MAPPAFPLPSPHSRFVGPLPADAAEVQAPDRDRRRPKVDPFFSDLVPEHTVARRRDRVRLHEGAAGRAAEARCLLPVGEAVVGGDEVRVFLAAAAAAVIVADEVQETVGSLKQRLPTRTQSICVSKTLQKRKLPRYTARTYIKFGQNAPKIRLIMVYFDRTHCGLLYLQALRTLHARKCARPGTAGCVRCSSAWQKSSFSIEESSFSIEESSIFNGRIIVLY